MAQMVSLGNASKLGMVLNLISVANTETDVMIKEKNKTVFLKYVVIIF